MVVKGSTSVGLLGLHIYGEPAGSTIDPTASSWSGDRHRNSGDAEFGDIIGDWREYGMMLSVL